MRLFICALWSPAGKGLTSWLSFVVSKCEIVIFPLVSWVRCGTLLYRFLIFAPLLTLLILICQITELNIAVLTSSDFQLLYLKLFRNYKLFHVCGVFRDLALLYALLRFLIRLRMTVETLGGSKGRVWTVLFGMHSVDSVTM